MNNRKASGDDFITRKEAARLAYLLRGYTQQATLMITHSLSGDQDKSQEAFGVMKNITEELVSLFGSDGSNDA